MFSRNLVAAVRDSVFPERSEWEPGLWDRLALALWGVIPLALRNGLDTPARFTDSVLHQTTTLTELDDQQLKRVREQICKELRSAVQQEKAVIKAFALILHTLNETTPLHANRASIAAGLAMLNGMVPEVDDYNDRLIATLFPICTAAFAGIPIHYLTASYLAANNHLEKASPIYSALGINASLVKSGMGKDERRRAYRCDVVYTSTTQVACDYIHDRLMLGVDQDRLQLAVEGLYRDRPRQDHIITQGLCFAIVDDLDMVLIDDAVTPITLSRNNTPRSSQRLYKEAFQLARYLQPDVDYVIDRGALTIQLTEAGKDHLQSAGVHLSRIWQGRKTREYLVIQALHVLFIFNRDEHYIVKEGKVIALEGAGAFSRAMATNRDFYKLLELKEISQPAYDQEVMARMSCQRFYRRYLLLSGITMSGAKCERELWKSYGLVLFEHKKNKMDPCDACTVINKTANDHWSDILMLLKRSRSSAKNILIVVRSHEDADIMSNFLSLNGIGFEVLDKPKLYLHRTEKVQVAMERDVHLISSQYMRHSSPVDYEVVVTMISNCQRLDRKLEKAFGAGNLKYFYSLDDELLNQKQLLFLLKYTGWLFGGPKKAPLIISRLVVKLAQRSVERQKYEQRQNNISMDDYLGRLLAFSGRKI